MIEYIIQMRRKQKSYFQELIKQSLPLPLQDAFVYVMNLGFEEEPNYQRLMDAFRETESFYPAKNKDSSRWNIMKRDEWQKLSMLMPPGDNRETLDLKDIQEKPKEM